MLLRYLALFILVTAGTASTLAQSYVSYFTGDTTDVITTDHQAGILLAGGGPDSNPAMQWLLERADGGDILVLRASGSDGYNDYLFGDLGIVVNSVETIKFNNADASNDPYVLRRIREAEAVFIAGGDQSLYVNYWRDSPVQTELNKLINEKRITVGGTSAGMAVLSGLYYAPVGPSLISIEALNDPFHPNAEGISNQAFLQAPFLENVITDTHFEQRDRQGRSLVFLARAFDLVGATARTISANEASALAIDAFGVGRAFGEYPTYDDYIFLLAPGCIDAPNGPEELIAGSPIVWERNGNAVSAYRMPATVNGTNAFDLSSWEPLDQSGDWQYWTASGGNLDINDDGNSPASCQPSNLNEGTKASLTISPLPFYQNLTINSEEHTIARITLLDINGHKVLQQKSPQLYTSDLASGLYFLHIQFKTGEPVIRKVVKQ